MCWRNTIKNIQIFVMKHLERLGEFACICVNLPNIMMDALDFTTVWPSGLRRWLKAPVRKGVGSNPTAVNNHWHCNCDMLRLPWGVLDGLVPAKKVSLCHWLTLNCRANEFGQSQSTSLISGFLSSVG